MACISALPMKTIKPKKLNGMFENESLQQALKALQLITPFSYTINKNRNMISSNITFAKPKCCYMITN